MKKIIAFLLVLPLLGCGESEAEQSSPHKMTWACEINKQIGKNRKPHKEFFLQCLNSLNIRPENNNESLAGLIEKCQNEAERIYPVDFNINKQYFPIAVTTEKCLIEPAAESTHTSQMPAEKPHQASAPKTEAVEQ